MSRLFWTAVLVALTTSAADAQLPPVAVPQVVLDTDAVRVVQYTFPPGAASGRHVGLEAELGIVVEGEITLVTDQGVEVLGPGTAHWLPPLVPHDVRNETDRPVKLWVVFLKRCS